MKEKVEIIPLVVTPFQQNCRIIVSAESKAVVIDPGGEADRIVQELTMRNLELEMIWLTHSHIDHCGGVARVLELSKGDKVELYAHPDEQMMREHVVELCAAFGISDADYANCPEPDHHLIGGETLEFGGHSARVLFTPGHSPGHLSFYFADLGCVISGDALFAGSVGRTDLPGGDYQQLRNSIQRELLSLPDETKVLSGHGPDTTIGEERATNPFLR